MIKSIVMRGIKSANGKQELTGRDIIIGPNGAGKTTRSQALGIALMGHVPGGGKLPAETMKLAHGDTMTVGLETPGFTVLREYARKGSKIEQVITLIPPNNGLQGDKVADKEERIEHELGKLPVMLDFSEFLSLSDMKRREFIYALAEDDEGMDSANKHLAVETLTQRLALPVTADPQEIEALAADIAECAEQYPDSIGVQAGLQAMLDYAKEQTTYWKKERDKATGAAQKMTEYKNDLAETDRSLDANNERLETLRADLTKVAAERTAADSENLRSADYNRKIAALRSEIAEIEAATNSGDAAELRDLISQYKTDIRQINHGAEIAAQTERAESAKAQITTLEKAVEKCLDDHNAVNSKKTASESLISKLSQQRGQCPIDCRIECDKDFTGLIDGLAAEIQDCEAEMRDICQQGTEARANLNNARQAIQDAQTAIDKLRSEEVATLRDNEGIQSMIRDLEAEIAKTENFDNEKATRLAAKRGELEGILPPSDGERILSEWAMIGTEEYAEREAAISADIQSLKAKIDEQTKARNALASLQSSMVDSVVAGYHAENWKKIADGVGPKGLQGELVKDTLAPLTEAVQHKLTQMGIDNMFYFQTEDDKGKEIFQFGWWSKISELNSMAQRRNFDALSTGEQLLLLIALMTTIIERLNPPLKILCIDNAESLDKNNLMRVINGLTTAGAEMDNIIFSGVMDISQVDVEPTWRVWDLSGGAA